MNDKLLKLWSDPRRVPIVIGLIAFNAGVGLGYFLGKRRVFNILEEQEAAIDITFEDSRLRAEFDKIKAMPSLTSIDVDKMREDLGDNGRSSKKVVETIIEPIPPTDDEVELVTRSVFDKTEDWDYEEEKKKRNKEEPYVLHKDEFFAEESDYSQVTVTYYGGDNILTDEDDTPIYNHEQVIGPLLFGHGSGDPNVFYVRNDRRRTEYEVVYDEGLYSVEVLGLEIENNQRVEDLKHSNRVPKFRQE